jgi:SAM-dependent methyltransferase
MIPFTEAVIREHIYRPIVGDVLMIGRQTVYHTPEQILDLFHRHGVDTGELAPGDIEIDRNTLNRSAASPETDFISDAALFRLMGIDRVMALDHSDYEGAEIVADLNMPLEISARADFIIDGSTLDNIFNPAQGLRNYAQLLRPGGRLLSANVYTSRFSPYSIVTPLWLLDYFVINGFVDCRVYITVTTPDSLDVFTINLDDLIDSARSVSTFVSPYEMSTMVFAEKGPQSTSEKFPSQQHYRSADEWKLFRRNLEIIRGNPRPHLLRSTGDITFADVAGGHLFVSSDFSARDPQTEINRTKARRKAPGKACN